MIKTTWNARRGKGRPRRSVDARRRYNVMFDPSIERAAVKIGDGNRSEGVERAIKFYLEHNPYEQTT